MATIDKQKNNNNDLFNFDDSVERDNLDDMDVSLSPLDDGGVEVSFTPIDELEEENQEAPVDFNEHEANILEFLDDETIMSITNYCNNRYDNDLESMDEFLDNINKGFAYLGITIDELNDPFPGASPVTHPLILESALKTQAKIMGEIFSGKGLVDTYLITETNEETIATSNRVRNYMDYQYLYQMGEYIPDTEKMTLRYSLTGNAFRKYYFDPVRNRPRTKVVHEDKFIVNANATTIQDLDFHTELYSIDRHALEHMIELGEFLDKDNLYIENEQDFYNNEINNPSLLYKLSEGVNIQESKVDATIIEETGESLGYSSSNSNGQFQLREHHAYLKLPEPFNDGTRRALPYIITIEPNHNKILNIRRNWKSEDPLRLKRTWYSHYKLIPGLGFHGMGYIHILGNFQFALTQILRSLIDSGQFSNLQGGFRAKGVRFTRDSTIPIKFGEFREIDTGSKSISDVLYPLDFKEPSQVLERMSQFLDGRAQKFADSTEQVIADSTNYGPVGTTVALLEASTKFVSGILKRYYNSLKEEFQILHDLNYDVLDETQDFYLKGESFTVKREDFNGQVDILPAADPNLSSSAHRIAVAQTKLAAAQQSPDIHNMREAYKEFYAQIGLEPEEIDRLMPPPEEAQPLDPLSDIIAAAQGKPIKAFPGQNHEAHIEFKTTFLSDPKGGAAPLAAAIVPILTANIQEHALLLYVRDLKGAMGNSAADTSESGDEMAIAEAGKRVKEFHESQAMEEGINARDPATMLAMAEAENAKTRREELDHKKEVDWGKLITENRKLDIDQLSLFQNSKDKKEQQLADLAKTRLQEGAKMVRESLTQLGEPNNKGSSSTTKK